MTAPSTTARCAAQNSASSRLRRVLLWLNGGAALGISAALILLSTPLLTMYGHEFLEGRLQSLSR